MESKHTHHTVTDYIVPTFSPGPGLSLFHKVVSDVLAFQKFPPAIRFRNQMKYITSNETLVGMNVDVVNGEKKPIFEVGDGFDTGNPAGLPPAVFMETMMKGMESDVIRKYDMLHSDVLAHELFRYYVNIGYVSKERESALNLTDLKVGVGAGSMHTWDLLMRVLVKPRDIVIFPTLTYGIFVPHVTYAGGKPYFMRTTQEADYKITPQQILDEIRSLNSKNLGTWMASLRPNIRFYFAQITNIPGVPIPLDPSWEDGITALEAKIEASGGANTAPHVVDKILEGFFYGEVFKGNKQLIGAAIGNGIKIPYPPRVRAMIHINPNLFGGIYTHDEVKAIVEALESLNVCIIEDLAYAGIDLQDPNDPSIKKISSIFNFTTKNAVSMLGLSKPYCMANLRVGPILGSKDIIEEVQDLIILTVNKIPTPVHDGLLALFRSPHDQLEAYLYRNTHEEESGYKTKRDLLLSIVNGTLHTPPESRRFEGVVTRQIEAFFEMKRQRGIIIVDKEYLTRHGVHSTPTCDVYELQRKYIHLITADFMKEGLKKYFQPAFTAYAGLFLILDCTRLMQVMVSEDEGHACMRPPEAGQVNTIEVFGLLSMLFSIRCLPEETMGPVGTGGPKMLRFSYSISLQSLVWGSFLIFVGIEQLRRLLKREQMQQPPQK